MNRPPNSSRARLYLWRRVARSLALGQCLVASALSAQPSPTNSTTDTEQPDARGWRIDYTAAEGCPERSRFLSEIDERLMESSTSADVASIAVMIEVSAGTYRGRLLMIDSSGDRSTRSVSGDDCGEVVSALALVTALALQAKLPSDEPGAEQEPAIEEAPVASPEAETEPTQPSITDEGSRLELGLHAGAASAYSPNPSATLRVFVGSSAPSFMARLWLGYAVSARTQTDLGQADFELLSTRGDVCALLGNRFALALGLCGSFELGYLHAGAQSSNTLDAFEGGLLWAAPGAVAQLGYALTSAWRLELAAGAQFPLYREQFIFRRIDGTASEIHEIPGAGWLGSAGVAFVVP